MTFFSFLLFHEEMKFLMLLNTEYGGISILFPAYSPLNTVNHRLRLRGHFSQFLTRFVVVLFQIYHENVFSLEICWCRRMIIQSCSLGTFQSMLITPIDLANFLAKNIPTRCSLSEQKNLLKHSKNDVSHQKIWFSKKVPV